MKNLFWSLYEYCLIMCKYYANIVQILCKYCANIVQILRKYCTNIIQIFFESNRAIQEHKRLNRAKCYPLTHPLTHFVKIQFIELHTQLKILCLNQHYHSHRFDYYPGICMRNQNASQLFKYCANIVQIIQIFFESNRALEEHKRPNIAKC